MGAVAVSNYNSNLCFSAVKELTDRGMKQVNIHQLLSETTLNQCWDLVKSYKEDSRLSKLNAIVFLMLKPKGKRNNLVALTDSEKFSKLINYCFDNNIPIGFDSCSASSVARHTKKELTKYIEPCESFLFSLYINVEGKIIPCSFAEGVEEEIDLLTINNFMVDVWESPIAIKWRKKLLDNNRECPIFSIEIK
jgi:MoaA/NifB/PqqE/SkfB family radical SAM enzyme